MDVNRISGEVKVKNDMIVENDFFTMRRVQGIAILEIRGNPLHNLADLWAKAALFDCLDEIDHRDDVRVMVIMSPAGKPGDKAYIDFFYRIRSGDPKSRYHHEMKDRVYWMDRDLLARFCNAVNQLVLKFVGLRKVIIHVDSGRIISPFLNLSLACDYRIIAAGSHYKNPYLELGLVPKGGSAFFLTRLVGYRRAMEFLFENSSVSADDALQLGVVDQVVPAADLYDTALKAARRYAGFPPGSVAGVKGLMNCSTSDLKQCLQREDELFIRILNSDAFIEKIKGAWFQGASFEKVAG